MGGKNMQCHMPDGRPDYEALALHADQQAEQAEARHLAALWRELATTYRELGQYHGALSTERLRFTGSASRLRTFAKRSDTVRPISPQSYLVWNDTIARHPASLLKPEVASDRSRTAAERLFGLSRQDCLPSPHFFRSDAAALKPSAVASCVAASSSSASAMT